MTPEAPLRPVDFVKKVGRGKTLSQDMSHAESLAAFSALLDGAFKPSQLGAFLQALRIKELTQEELDALAEVFHARTRVLAPLATTKGVHGGSGGKTLVLNLASDTGRKGGVVALLAAHLLRSFGIAVGLVRSAPVLSGNRASLDVTLELVSALEAWLPVTSSAALRTASAAPATSSASATSSALGPALMLVGCADLIPGLAALDEVRNELGFRSCLHTAEKLLNPWPRSPMLLGISHKHYALRMAATMAARGLSGKILLGNHGTVDLVLHKETELVSVDAGGIREETLSPAALGLELAPEVYTLGNFPRWREWLAEGPASGNGLWKAIHYHVAVQLWAAGEVSTAAAGLALARALFKIT